MLSHALPCSPTLSRVAQVYDDEPIDADVTAEIYQPTEQLAELVVAKDVVLDGGVVDGSGHVALKEASGLSFKIGAETFPIADTIYFFARVHDLAKPYHPPAYGPLRAAFPAANRGAALRKFHLRTFLTKQREAGIPFASTASDFQLLLHASGLLPAELMERLCAAVASTGTTKTAKDKAAAALAEAEGRLAAAAGMAEGGGGGAGGGGAKAKKKKPRY